jgi:alkaline phosphatase
MVTQRSTFERCRIGFTLVIAISLAGCTATPSPTPLQSPTPPVAASPTSTPSDPAGDAAILIAAGDVASCSTRADEETGVLAGHLRDAAVNDHLEVAVALLGDGAYPSGSAAEWSDCYGPAWGSFKSITHPAVGNHEYLTDGASPYFSYFGSAAGSPETSWYSYTIGAWRIIVLNSECAVVGCGTGSAQYRWLATELAGARAAEEPVAAMWHQPRFSTGEHGDALAMQPIWSALASAGVAFVLNGHEHNYERWEPLTATGRPASAGITEFIVGTGGADLRAQRRSDPRSAVYLEVHGVIRLALASDSYSWEMISIDGSVVDHGRVMLAP